MTFESATPVSGSIVTRGSRITVYWAGLTQDVTITYDPQNGGPIEQIYQSGASGYGPGYTGSATLDALNSRWIYVFSRNAGWGESPFGLSITEGLERQDLSYTLLAEGQYPPQMVPFTEPVPGGAQLLVEDDTVLQGAANTLNFGLGLNVVQDPADPTKFTIDAPGGAGGNTILITDPGNATTPSMTASTIEFGDNLVITNLGGGVGRVDAAAALSFLDLTDTPGVVPGYTGQGGRFVSVKIAEDGLEFTDAPPGTFIDLTDVNVAGNTYAGKAEYVARVNQAGTGMEVVAPIVAQGGQEVVGGVTTDGAGGVTIDTGSTGISAVQIDGTLNLIDVDFTSPFADTNYFAQLTNKSAANQYVATITAKATDSITVQIVDTAGDASVDPTAVPVAFDIIVQDDPVGGGGAGDITGPVTSTVDAIPRWGDTTGSSLLDSGWTIDSSDNLTNNSSATLTMDGNIAAPNIIASTLLQATAGSTAAFDVVQVDGVAEFRDVIRQLERSTAPSIPGAGAGLWYTFQPAAGNNRPYFMDETGQVFDLTAGSGSGTVNTVSEVAGTTVTDPDTLSFVGDVGNFGRVVDGGGGTALVKVHDLNINDGGVAMTQVSNITLPTGTIVTRLAGGSVSDGDTIVIGGLVLEDGTSLMSGAYTPTDDRHVATKKYVDDNAGGGGTGNLRSDGTVPMDAGYTPTVPQDIATKSFTESLVGGGTGGIATYVVQNVTGDPAPSSGSFNTTTTAVESVGAFFFSEIDSLNGRPNDTLDALRIGDVLYMRNAATPEEYLAYVVTASTKSSGVVRVDVSGMIDGAALGYTFTPGDTYSIGIFAARGTLVNPSQSSVAGQAPVFTDTGGEVVQPSTVITETEVNANTGHRNQVSNSNPHGTRPDDLSPGTFAGLDSKFSERLGRFPVNASAASPNTELSHAEAVDLTLVTNADGTFRFEAYGAGGGGGVGLGGNIGLYTYDGSQIGSGTNGQLRFALGGNSTQPHLADTVFFADANNDGMGSSLALLKMSSGQQITFYEKDDITAAMMMEVVSVTDQAGFVEITVDPAKTTQTTGGFSPADPSEVGIYIIPTGDVGLHIADTDNPHQTSLANIGAGFVSDLNTALLDSNVTQVVQPNDIPQMGNITGNPQYPAGNAAQLYWGSPPAGYVLTSQGGANVPPAFAPGGGAVTTVTGQNSVENVGSTIGDVVLQLTADQDTPGNSKYYGTDGAGTKGYHDLPAGGGGGAPYSRIAYFGTAGQNITTTFTFTDIDNLTLTPPAGTYLVSYSVAVSTDTQNVISDYGVALDADLPVPAETQYYRSADFTTQDGITFTASAIATIAGQVHITTTGTEAIKVKARLLAAQTLRIDRGVMSIVEVTAT